MTQTAIIGLHLFGQCDHSHQSFMPPMCEETTAMGSGQHPFLTCSVPPVSISLHAPDPCFGSSWLWGYGWYSIQPLKPVSPLRSANTPTVGLGWGEPFKENKRKIPRPIKRNMFSECFFPIANWTCSKILTWRAQPSEAPQALVSSCHFTIFFFSLNALEMLGSLSKQVRAGPAPRSCRIFSDFLNLLCLWVGVPSCSHWARAAALTP